MLASEACNAAMLNSSLQIDDDIEAEARQRVTGLVSTAARHRKEQSGVWAPFGRPYQALGKVETVRGPAQPPT